MPITIDGPGRLFVLSSGTTTLDVKDLYSRWKEWVLAADNSKYLPAFDSIGGQDIDTAAGTKIPAYLFLLNGWRVRPQAANHTLSVTSGVLLVAGGGDPFVDTVAAHVVRINYQQPVQAIGTSSGGGGLTPEQAAQLALVHAVITGHLETDPVEGKLQLFQGGTLTHEAALYADTDGTVPFDGTQPVLRRDELEPVP